MAAVAHLGSRLAERDPVGKETNSRLRLSVGVGGGVLNDGVSHRHRQSMGPQAARAPRTPRRPQRSLTPHVCELCRKKVWVPRVASPIRAFGGRGVRLDQESGWEMCVRDRK